MPIDDRSTQRSSSEPPVQIWTGPNREQILDLPTRTSLEIPIDGKFKAIEMKAYIPGNGPSHLALLHMQVNGHEVYVSPPLKSGEEPMIIRAPVKNAQTATFIVESTDPDLHVFLIDPVVIRD